MNGFDVFLVLFMIIFLYLGFRYGLIRQLLCAAALYIGLAIATLGYQDSASLIQSISADTTSGSAQVIAFFLITLIITIVLFGLTALIYQETRTQLHRILDSILGGLAGVFTSLLIIGVLLVVMRYAIGVDWGAANDKRDILNIAQRTSLLSPVLAPASQVTLSALLPWTRGNVPGILNP